MNNGKANAADYCMIMQKKFKRWKTLTSSAVYLPADKHRTISDIWEKESFESFGYCHRLTTNLPDFTHIFRHEERAEKLLIFDFFSFLLSSSHRVKLKMTAAACFSLMAFPYFKLG